QMAVQPGAARARGVAGGDRSVGAGGPRGARGICTRHRGGGRLPASGARIPARIFMIMNATALSSLGAAGVLGLLVSAGACSRPAEKAAAPAAPPVRVYVTNEASGDISVIDPATQAVIATVKVGKRPRGLRISPDR